MLTQLDTENADLDLTTEVVVLTHTPDAANPRMCQVCVLLGDGAKNLDGSGGNFTLRVNVGAAYGETRTIALPAQARGVLQSLWFGVPANAAVTVRVLSPNVVDTDVDVTAYLLAFALTVAVADKTGFALAADGLDSIATTAPAGVAANFREMLVQLWRRYFKKTTMTGSQLRTYADDGATVVTTQALSDDGTTQTQGAGT